MSIHACMHLLGCVPFGAVTCAMLRHTYCHDAKIKSSRVLHVYNHTEYYMALNEQIGSAWNIVITLTNLPPSPTSTALPLHLSASLSLSLSSPHPNTRTSPLSHSFRLRFHDHQLDQAHANQLQEASVDKDIRRLGYRAVVRLNSHHPRHTPHITHANTSRCNHRACLSLASCAGVYDKSCNGTALVLCETPNGKFVSDQGIIYDMGLLLCLKRSKNIHAHTDAHRAQTKRHTFSYLLTHSNMYTRTCSRVATVFLHPQQLLIHPGYVTPHIRTICRDDTRMHTYIQTYGQTIRQLGIRTDIHIHIQHTQNSGERLNHLYLSGSQSPLNIVFRDPKQGTRDTHEWIAWSRHTHPK